MIPSRGPRLSNVADEQHDENAGRNVLLLQALAKASRNIQMMWPWPENPRTCNCLFVHSSLAFPFIYERRYGRWSSYSMLRRPVHLIARSQSTAFFMSRWHVVFRRPLFLFPGISVLNTDCPQCVFLISPYHQFNLDFSPWSFWKPAALSLSLACVRSPSCLCMRIVTPHIQHRRLVTSIRCSWRFVVSNVSVPYSIASLITVL